ncbi:NAD-dependent epimerase/dehydratase domain-containing protein [uncultured Gammaproteobacteria bacterium]
MKVIVFGGSGFLGGYVVDELIARGHQVAVFDRSPPANAPLGTRFIAGDVLDPAAVDRAVDGFEIAYHFAGQPDIGRSVADPVGTITLNVLGTSHVLDACRRFKITRMLFASTLYIFSDCGAFYGASKHCCERLVDEFSKTFGLDTTIIRYGSVYGERADAQNRIFRILHQAIEQGKIVFPGDGSEVREYIHGMDAARLSVDLLDPAFRNQAVMLTGAERYRYRDLLELIREILGGKVAIEYQNLDYPGHYHLSPYSFVPKLSRKLVANPALDLGQGLLHCIRHVHDTLKAQATLAAGVTGDQP